uniref:BRCT domain-containing protein n=2 Tax=Mesocestoides corti TaxID=53468 RepID=A0A5K3EPW1_MESCO
MMSHSCVSRRGLLHGVVAYVDIRSPFGNPENVVAERLSSLGAIVERTRSAFVTHVVFRNGDPMTRLWAEKRGINLVTPAWVKACVEGNSRVPEACYYLRDKQDVDMAEDPSFVNNSVSLVQRIDSVASVDAHATQKSILEKSSTDPSVIENFISNPSTPLSTRLLQSCSDSRAMNSDSLKELGPQTVAGISLTGSSYTQVELSNLTTQFSFPDSHFTPPLQSTIPPSSLSVVPSLPPASERPPPGWMRPPLSPKNVDSSSFFITFKEQPTVVSRPRLSDVFGSTALPHKPFSPDNLHFFVQNLSSSTGTHRNWAVDKKSPSHSPMRVTPGSQKSSKPKSSPVTYSKKTPTRRRSSLRRRLLKKAVQSSSDHKIFPMNATSLISSTMLGNHHKQTCSSMFSSLKSGNLCMKQNSAFSHSIGKYSEGHWEEKDGLATSDKRILSSKSSVLPSVAPRSTSLRMPEKIDIQVRSVVKPLSGLPRVGSAETTATPKSRKRFLERTVDSLVVDSEISLKPLTISLSPLTVRNSIEEFVLSDVLKPTTTRTKRSLERRPIEILFSGLHSYQRQTLIALLRSSYKLSQLEVVPALNRRLCGDASGVVQKQRTPIIAETEDTDQRWSVTDSLHPETTTHLVSTSPFPRTINLFKAVMASIPVVDQAWLEESAKEGKWLPYERFLVSFLAWLLVLDFSHYLVGFNLKPRHCPQNHHITTHRKPDSEQKFQNLFNCAFGVYWST